MSPNLGIIIPVRHSSSRLPGKATLPLCGLSPLSRVINRCRDYFSLPIVVATSDSPDDHIIHNWCSMSGISCYRGSLDDVANRYLSAANYFSFDYSIRINCDRVVFDVDIVKTHLAAFSAFPGYDIYSNFNAPNYIAGHGCEIISTSALGRYSNQFSKFQSEHITKWFYENPSAISILNIPFPFHTLENVSHALDTRNDFTNISSLITSLNNNVPPSIIDHLSTRMPFPAYSNIELIAEIGGNHEGSLQSAIDLTLLAINAGAKVIKHQVYSPDLLVNPIIDSHRHNHFSKFALGIESYIQLADICHCHNVEFMASVWSISELEMLDPYLLRYKIGSGDLTNYPLISWMCSRRKPIILSTGLSTLEEVSQCVSFIRNSNPFYKNNNLTLLQCTSMYPIPAEESNLAVMHAYSHLFSCPVGYSDHTVGLDSIKQAVSMGANVIEFHFSSDNTNQSFRDHLVSLTPHDVSSLIDFISEFRLRLGCAIKEPTHAEKISGHIQSMRKSLYSVVPVSSGTPFSQVDLIALRPSEGLDPRLFDSCQDCTFTRSLSAYEAFSLTDLSRID